jgi:hypothetical protein
MSARRYAVASSVLSVGYLVMDVVPNSGHVFGVPVSYALFAAIVAVYAAVYVTKRRIVTGSDGFEVHGFRSRRFVPYTDVSHVDAEGVIHLRASGERIALGRPMSKSARQQEAAPYARALARIREKAEKARVTAARAESAALAVDVATSGAGARALAGAGPAASYRVAAPTEDVLLEAVAAGQARPSVRARAAQALLAERADPEVRARISAIASEAASTEARDALLAVVREADLRERAARDEAAEREADDARDDAAARRRSLR